MFGADLVPGSRLTELYEPLMVGRAAFISFQTVAELRFGALRREWGGPRLPQLHMKIARAQVVHSDEKLVVTYAELRAACERSGHALGQPDHDADRWIAPRPSALTCRCCRTTESSGTLPASSSKTLTSDQQWASGGAWCRGVGADPLRYPQAVRAKSGSTCAVTSGDDGTRTHDPLLAKQLEPPTTDTAED